MVFCVCSFDYILIRILKLRSDIKKQGGEYITNSQRKRHLAPTLPDFSLASHPRFKAA